MAEEKSTTVVDAVPTTLDDSDGTLRLYIGDDKKNLDCRFYEEQVSLSHRFANRCFSTSPLPLNSFMAQVNMLTRMNLSLILIYMRNCVFK